MKIVLKIVNKRIFVENEFKIVNNNTDYTIKFMFDKEWSVIDDKTLRIEFENGNYIDTPFTGDTVTLPQISNQNSFRLGVYAGDLHSTSILAVSCENSILDGGGCEYIIKPTESIEITDTEEIDVTHYSTAQVVDENLVPGNIRKGANILGVQGSFEQEDPSAAEVSYDNSESGLAATDVQSAIDELSHSGGAVDSVNGKTGTVVINKSDVGLSNVDNTADFDKPISNDVQLALDAKMDSAPIEIQLETGGRLYPFRIQNVKDFIISGEEQFRVVLSSTTQDDDNTALRNHSVALPGGEDPNACHYMEVENIEGMLHSDGSRKFLYRDNRREDSKISLFEFLNVSDILSFNKKDSSDYEWHCEYSEYAFGSELKRVLYDLISSYVQETIPEGGYTEMWVRLGRLYDFGGTSLVIDGMPDGDPYMYEFHINLYSDNRVYITAENQATITVDHLRDVLVLPVMRITDVVYVDPNASEDDGDNVSSSSSGSSSSSSSQPVGPSWKGYEEQAPNMLFGMIAQSAGFNLYIE